MPRERVRHGKMWVEDASVPPTEAVNSVGQPTGLHAHAMRQHFPGDVLPEGTKVIQEPSLEVCWNRDTGWMQVAAIVSIQQLRDIVAAVDRDEMPMEGDLVGIHVDFDRQDANNLIRVVRRARNAAFGGDE